MEEHGDYLQEPNQNIDDEVYNASLPMDEIEANPFFNCRGMDITPATVVDLAEDIRKYGLHQPIMVRPINVDGKSKIKYSVVAGHRRHTACKFLGMKTIKAFIKNGLTEDQAYVINLAENIKRVQLNIAQEAQAVARLMGLGYMDKDIRERLDVSIPWLKVRKELLTLPAEVREEAANGNLSQAHITELARLAEEKPPEDVIKAAAKIRDRKLKNDKTVQKVDSPEEVLAKEAKKVEESDGNKFRTNTELDKMQDLMLAILQGTNLGARTIAWARMQITTLELLEDVKREAGYMGIVFNIPQEYYGVKEV